MPRASVPSGASARRPPTPPIPFRMKNNLIATAMMALCMLGACSEKPAAPSTPSPASTAAATNPATPADATYTVRGRIDGLPTPDGKSYLHIHHEDIPDFKGRDGKVTGMNEMSMDFLGIAPGVDLSQLKVGDPIEFTFEVRWKSDPRSLVTKIVKLPPDTKLRLSDEGK